VSFSEIWAESRSTVLFLLVTALFACFPILVRHLPTGVAFTLVLLSVILLFFIPAFSLARKLQDFSVGSRRSAFLFIYYAELILAFAAAYFLLSLIGGTGSHFSGLIPEITGVEENYGFVLAFSHFFDFLYFSVVTATTLGYGDIQPSSWQAKSMVMLQVLLALHIVVVGFGSYFSSGADNEERR
jgi:hypothetical protein